MLYNTQSPEHQHRVALMHAEEDILRGMIRLFSAHYQHNLHTRKLSPYAAHADAHDRVQAALTSTLAVVNNQNQEIVLADQRHTGNYE